MGRHQHMSRCAAGLLLCAVARAGRTRTPLTFGWKFHLGDVSESGGNDGNETLLCPADAFQQFDGMVCPGWAHNGAYKQTEESCRSYCCGDPGCAGYHFKPPQECFIGADTTTCVKDTTGAARTGGMRPVPALIPTPGPNGPHTASFDDSSWREVSLPHVVIDAYGDVSAAPRPWERR